MNLSIIIVWSFVSDVNANEITTRSLHTSKVVVLYLKFFVASTIKIVAGLL